MWITTQNYVMLILATIIPTGFSIQCFQCNSVQHPKCADIKANDTDSPFLQECNGNYDGKEPFCRKIVTKVLDTEDQRIVRTCGWILEKHDVRKDICKKRDTDFILNRSCACFADKCNASNNLRVSYWTLFVFLCGIC